ncbi:MAG: peptidylprolyl isomerase [Gammaproteobacteria bacterium]|nr:peptidylprolyl isomerase [Gammaproteobacteria bacterium]
MKKITKLMLALALVASTHAIARPLDRVIVVVNDDVIMQSQLDDRVGQILAQYPADQLPPREELETQVLNRLVEETLELEVARRASLNVSDREVMEAIGRIAAGNGQNLDQLQQAIEASGQTIYSFREQIRREMTLNRVQEGAVNARIEVTPQEIANFLASDEGQNYTATNYNVAHILLETPPDSTAEQLNTIAQEAQYVHELASSGESFEQLARSYSDAPDGLEGGNLGWRRVEQLPTLFANYVQNMEVGEITQPFRSGAGYHILTLLEKRGAEDQVIIQTEVRHILLKPNAIRSSEASLEEITELRQQVLDGADFGELAREFSEDYGSARLGGSLGWSNPGSFVPQFEAAMGTLEIDEISEPIQTQFGWHILQVTGRRDQNMSERFLEMQAENFLRSRKFYDELPRWRQELRDDAFIVYKEPYDERM